MPSRETISRAPALAQALGPAQETVEKRAGFERGKEAVESVVAGDAVAQREKGFEPVMLGVAEVVHVVEALSTAQQGAQGDDEDVGQIVIAPALDTGIGQLFEVCEQAELGRRVGWRVLHPVSSSHTVQKYKDKMAHPSFCLMRLPWHSLEVQNLHNALQYLENLAKSDGALTEKEIREVHALVLGQGERDAGRYRTIEVAITNSPHKPPIGVAVPGEMEKLAGWIQSRPPIPVPLLAAVAHAWLVHIHPFTDGNGRTARAVTNLLLMRAGFPVVIIRRKDRQRYYETLRAADDGDIGLLLELLVQRSQDSLHQIDRIRNAAAGINNAILQVQAAERQRFQI